jgi:hypothetical protein
VIGNRHPSRHSFCSLPTKRSRACQDAGSRVGTSNQAPSRCPRSTLWIARRYTASDPRPDMFPSWGRVGCRMSTLQPLRCICRHDVQACN